MLQILDRQVEYSFDIEQVKRFHYLYERCATDLTKLAAFPAENEIRRSLESLVARAYSEIHETRGRRTRFNPMYWFFRTFPQTFRRHAVAFAMSVVLMFSGSGFGGIVLMLDPDAKEVLLPFAPLLGDPSDRVAHEESEDTNKMAGVRTAFSAQLMTHNTKVSVLTLALGMVWGLGTAVMLFYNGVILGVVGLDYILAGETKFLLGWLLPHGAIEIPSILMAGQAGLILGGALIGWGSREPVRRRLRIVGDDLVTLIFGVGILLIWAGIVEAFFSQYHEPFLPYSLKIGFGVTEVILLSVFLGLSGRKGHASDAGEGDK
jgi:uncharacterized membrane protein SpoIIM required for sporulation